MSREFAMGAEDRVRSFCCGRVGQSAMLPLRGNAEAETMGGSVWQWTTVSVLERLAGACGTVQMPESRGHDIALRFLSIAAYRRWLPIPKRRTLFSRLAMQGCSSATMAGLVGCASAPMRLCRRSGR